MTKEIVSEEVLKISSPHILLELPTSYGKSKLALDRMEQCIACNKNVKILVVVPRLALINNWKKEFKKWNREAYLNSTVFSTYASLHHHTGKWDMVIFDECHHLTERCRGLLQYFNISNSVLLSATVKKELKEELTVLFRGLYIYSISMREAIDDEVLPDPKVYLMPLELPNNIPTEVIIKNPKGVGNITTSWATRWDYIRQKKYKVTIYCTQLQYYQDLCSQITYWKNSYMRTRKEAYKNKWLLLCGRRLSFLSDAKIPTVKMLLKKLSKERTLTFCNSIQQTEMLGKHCVNSKNKERYVILDKFNKQEIDHITACNMLNEGMNLVNCRVGIYNNLNSSETIIKQRLGRLLRHKDPILIIPYYKGTREEEIVEKMLEDYNPELVKTIVLFDQIKL